MFTDELKNRLKHVHAYAVTPFKPQDVLQIDLSGFARNLEFMIERGIKIIAIAGGTGEINALTVEELEQLTRTALDVAGDRALIIPGLPGNLGTAAKLAPRYETMGVQVALGLAPFIRNLVPNDLDGVWNYYALLGRCSGIALMPYNTQVWPPEFFRRLADIDQVIGIKDPCIVPHNLFRAIQQVGDRLVWIGNKRHDPGVLHLRFQAGIEGFSAGFTNFAPQFELELFAAANERDWDQMVNIQQRLAPLERLRNDHTEGIVKSALNLVGLVGGPVRPPRTNTSPKGIMALRHELVQLGIEVIQQETNS